jgi:hypothetical protein
MRRYTWHISPEAISLLVDYGADVCQRAGRLELNSIAQ